MGDSISKADPWGAEAAGAAEAGFSYEPKTMKQALWLSDVVMRSGLSSVQNPQQALLVAAIGRDLGLSFVQACRTFAVIRGRVCMPAQLMVAVVRRSGLAEYFDLVESSAKSATWATKRQNSKSETRKTITIDCAKRAGWTERKNSPWATMPQTMCEWRAASQLCRLVYSDVLGGLYAVDEMQDADAAHQQGQRQEQEQQEQEQQEQEQQEQEQQAALEQFCRVTGVTQERLERVQAFKAKLASFDSTALRSDDPEVHAKARAESERIAAMVSQMSVGDALMVQVSQRDKGQLWARLKELWPDAPTPGSEDECRRTVQRIENEFFGWETVG